MGGGGGTSGAGVGISACWTGGGVGRSGAVGASGAAGGSDVAAGPSPTMKSTVSGSDAPVGRCVAGIINKASSNVRCSPSESQTGQPSVSRRCTRTTIRWLLLSIDRTGLRGFSPQNAPVFEIADLSGETEPITIGHGGAFQSPQWQAGFPTGGTRSPATGWKSACPKFLIFAAHCGAGSSVANRVRITYRCRQRDGVPAAVRESSGSCAGRAVVISIVHPIAEHRRFSNNVGSDAPSFLQDPHFGQATLRR